MIGDSSDVGAGDSLAVVVIGRLFGGSIWIIGLSCYGDKLSLGEIVGLGRRLGGRLGGRLGDRLGGRRNGELRWLLKVEDTEKHERRGEHCGRGF